MATTTTHGKFNEVYSPHNEAIPFVRSFTVALGVLADAAKVLKIPRGRRITNPWLQSGDRDTHATPTHTMSLVITNGTTTKTLIHESDVGQAGGVARPSKIPATEDGLDFVAPDDTYWLQVTVTAAAATAVADGAAAAKLLVGGNISGAYDSGSI